MENIRITIVQSDLFWENKKANLDAFDDRLAGLSGKTDLIVLPEMFTTGFSMNTEALAENMQGPTMQWLKNKAARLNAVLTGSFIAEEEGRYYNRMVWMEPNGDYEYYDKRHLFTLAGEQDHYHPGRTRRIIEYKGWKILPLICYDLRFPVWSRNTDDYDLLLYVANWPERRRHAWQSLLIARAIENQAYTVGVNRVGTDGKEIPYSGDSIIIDGGGQTICHLAGQENTVTCTLSKAGLTEFRKKLNFLPDRDRFHLEL